MAPLRSPHPIHTMIVLSNTCIIILQWPLQAAAPPSKPSGQSTRPCWGHWLPSQDRMTLQGSGMHLCSQHLKIKHDKYARMSTGMIAIINMFCKSIVFKKAWVLKQGSMWYYMVTYTHCISLSATYNLNITQLAPDSPRHEIKNKWYL